MLGNTLVGRYQIIRLLGGGGFGETFVASDTHLPGKPQCVVKKLQPQENDPVTLQTARRLFDTEAQVLYKLGTYEYIPQLLAYFEEQQEFYLVQEFIAGHDLSQELTPQKTLGETEVVSLLQEILEILEFVHQQKVIHRDINPRNILRRDKDGKLVLIDFGAVKQITTSVVTSHRQTKFTVAIGTPGYTPSEQAQGEPKYSSDIYAVGIIGIQALTGLSPEDLQKDGETNEIIWQNNTTVSQEFAQILDKMVRYDFRQRYSYATDTLKDLKNLHQPKSGTVVLGVAPLRAKVKGQPINYKKIIRNAFLGISLIGVGIAASMLIADSINTNNATELSQKANVFYELQRYQDALSNYEKAIDLRPDYSLAWNGKAESLYKLKKYSEALLAYDKAIQLQPDYWSAWKGRGLALNELQRYPEAIASFDKALGLDATPQVWNAKGEALSNIKRYDEAITSYQQATEIQPDYYQAWENKAKAYYQLQEYKQALEAYDKVIDIKPNYVGAWYNRGNTLVSLRRYEDAYKAYDKAVTYQPNYYQAWLSRGNMLMSLGRYPQAIESFEEVIKYSPRNYQAQYNLGWSFHQTLRYDRAIAAYDRAIAIKRNDYQVWYNRGNSLYILGKYLEAIASYDNALRYKSDHSESWYSKGNALFNLEKYQQAIAAYDKAIEYNRDYQQAIEARKKAEEKLPDKNEEIKSGLWRLFNPLS